MPSPRRPAGNPAPSRGRPSAAKTVKTVPPIATARFDRRQAILAAACDVFLEMGYGAATIDQVINRVGGSKRTVYGYFNGKEALFAAVVDEIVGEIVRPLPDIDAIALGVRETLQVVAEQHVNVVLSERHAALMRLVAAEASRFPEIGRAYYEHGPARGHKKLETYFIEQTRVGSLDIADAAQATDFFWGMALHHATLRRLYNVMPAPKPAEVRSVCAAVVDLFLAVYATTRTRQRRRG